MTDKIKKKPDYKASKYKDGRSQGVPNALSTKRTRKDEEDPRYGSPESQARRSAFRAAVALKSNKKASKDVKMPRKGK